MEELTKYLADNCKNEFEKVRPICRTIAEIVKFRDRSYKGALTPEAKEAFKAIEKIIDQELNRLEALKSTHEHNMREKINGFITDYFLHRVEEKFMNGGE